MNKYRDYVLLGLAAIITASTAWAISTVTIPYVFVPNTTAASAKVNANFTAVATGANAVIGAVNTAAGSKATLAQRLNVSMNADGTFRNVTGVTAGSEWQRPALLHTYSTTTKFTVTGDQTDIYLGNRRIKATLAGGISYSEVAAATYSSGTGTTLVTLEDAILTNPITSIEHATTTPYSYAGSSLSALNLISTVKTSTDTYYAPLPTLGLWSDYTATSTITGWTGGLAKAIYYMTIGKLVFVSFYIDGTSNSTDARFTVPAKAANIANVYYSAIASAAQDNGVDLTTPCTVLMAPDQNYIYITKGMNTGAWTASGNKIVRGNLWYISQ